MQIQDLSSANSVASTPAKQDQDPVLEVTDNENMAPSEEGVHPDYRHQITRGR